MHGTFASTLPPRDPRPLRRRLQTADRTLMLFGTVMLLVLAATSAGLLLDPRVITGAPAWLKPAKFAISIAVYSFTLAWLLSFVEGHRLLVRLVASVTAVTLGIELLIIGLQVLRGTTSHFNMATPLDAALWGTMGGMIALTWLANAVAALLLLRQRCADPAFAWSLRLGLLLSLVGMAVAVPMAVLGAHTIGAPDGGPGLPLVGWSTVAGDLRVAHFVGLHALQLLPLLGWLLARPGLALPVRHRRALVVAAALGYLGLTLLLTAQAVRGQSVVAPDMTTLTLAAAVIVALSLATGAILWDLRRQRPARSQLAHAGVQ